MEAIAKVINNNQVGWTNIIETAPNVTLDIGTKLYIDCENKVAGDYAYKNIEEYEELTNSKVDESFKIAWAMARATMEQLRDL